MSPRHLARDERAAAGWNCVAGGAHLFGLPVPKLPESWTTKGGAAKKFLDDLQGIEAQLEATHDKEASGMDLGDLQAFAEYLNELEGKRGEGAVHWKKQLFRIEDKAVPGRLTFASKEQCGTHGGDEHKAKVDEQTKSGPASNAEGAEAAGDAHPAKAEAQLTAHA